MKTLVHTLLEPENENFDVPKESYETLDELLNKAQK